MGRRVRRLPYLANKPTSEAAGRSAGRLSARERVKSNRQDGYLVDILGKTRATISLTGRIGRRRRRYL